MKEKKGEKERNRRKYREEVRGKGNRLLDMKRKIKEENELE